jgi:hypothetical protein
VSRRRTAVVLAAALVALLPATADAQHGVPVESGIGNDQTIAVARLPRPANRGNSTGAITLQVGDRGQHVVEVQYVLASHGYVLAVDGWYGQQTERAVRHWQRANGLLPDGVVGPITWASIMSSAPATVEDRPASARPVPPARPSLVPATPLAPAVRVDPPPSPAPPECDAECVIRDVWPDQLEDRAVAIAWREARLQPQVINRNGDATGLFQIMWSVHRRWLCPQMGVCAQAQLQDARTNATAALALYDRDGGWGPWAL